MASPVATSLSLTLSGGATWMRLPKTSGTNGMSDQGANSSGYEYVVTGAVLLLAAGF